MNNFWLDKPKTIATQGACKSGDTDVSEMMEAYRSQLEDEYLTKAELLEDEYNAKLTEAYEQLPEEMRACEAKIEQTSIGAWAIIRTLQKKLAEIEEKKCPDCGYHPGERGNCGAATWGNLPPDWAIDL